jgi:hypothetical protein
VANNAEIKITADSSQALREIANVEKALKSLEKVTDLAGKGLQSIGAFAAGAAAALGLAAVRLDDLGDAADAIGIGVNQLKALQSAAAGAGVDAGALEAGFRKLSGNLGEAFLNNSSSAAKALKQLGLESADLLKLSPDQQMLKLATELNKIENPAIRAALSVDLLGKGAERLLQAFKDPAAIEAYTKKLEKLGLAISQQDLDNIDSFDKKVREINGIWKAFTEKAVAALAPYLEEILDKIVKLVEEAGGFEGVLLNILDVIEMIAKATVILASLWIGGKLISGAITFAGWLSKGAAILGSIAGIASKLPGPLGRAGKALVLGLGAVGVGYAATEAYDAYKENFIDPVSGQFDALRASLAKTRAARQTTQAAKSGPSAADLQEQLRKAIQNSTTDYLEQYAAQTKTIGATRQQVEEQKIAEAIAKESKKDIKDVLRFEQERIKAAAANRITKELEQAITKDLNALELERVGLGIVDKNQREIAVAIRAKELEFGRKLTQEEENRLRTGIVLTQQARERSAIAQAIYDFTRKQTELEKIQRGIGLQATLDPTGTANKGYVKDQEALQAMLDNKLVSETEYYNQRAKLAENYNMQIMQLQSQEFQNFNRLNDMKIQRSAEEHAAKLRNETTFLGTKMFNEDTIQQIAKDRATFEKKTELEKGQFFIQQGAEVFSALGAQNKKAFEAAKALNIANAIMNTYAGATKALATYPWPFGLVAAAAAVASGMAQVAQIRSQSYSGRALGGPVMGGTPYLVGESGPELFTPNTTGSITRNGDLGGSTTNVNFTIVANDAQGFDDLLLQRRGLITQIISDARLEQGMR